MSSIVFITAFSYSTSCNCCIDGAWDRQAALFYGLQCVEQMDPCFLHRQNIVTGRMQNWWLLSRYHRKQNPLLASEGITAAGCVIVFGNSPMYWLKHLIGFRHMSPNSWGIIIIFRHCWSLDDEQTRWTCACPLIFCKPPYFIICFGDYLGNAHFISLSS